MSYQLTIQNFYLDFSVNFFKYTFTLLRDNGKPCHRLVTWKDCRAREECKKWNSSWSLKVPVFIFTRGFFFETFSTERIFRYLSIYSIILCISSKYYIIFKSDVKSSIKRKL